MMRGVLSKLHSCETVQGVMSGLAGDRGPSDAAQEPRNLELLGLRLFSASHVTAQSQPRCRPRKMCANNTSRLFPLAWIRKGGQGTDK